MKLFLHRHGSDNVETLEPSTEISIRTLVGVTSEHSVWVEDETEPIDLDQDARSIAPGRSCHLFCGPSRCRRVIAAVRYNGETISREFPPATRIIRILRWAISDEEFRLVEPDVGDFVFKLSSRDCFPDVDDLVGRYVGDDCEVMLDLCPADKFQGSPGDE